MQINMVLKITRHLIDVIHYQVIIVTIILMLKIIPHSPRSTKALFLDEQLCNL